MEPNKDRIQLWADACKSGEYSQIAGRLRNSDGFCCLGIACEIATQNGLDVEKLVKDHGCDFYYYYGEELNSQTLPAEVIDWYGFSSADPIIYNEYGDDNPASYWNDTERQPLEEIGEMIEITFLRGG